MSRSGRSALILAFLSLVLGALLLARAYPGNLHEYQLYLSETRPELRLRFSDLSQDWTENDLQRQFSQLRWRCYDNRPGEYLDDRSCFADIQALNGVGAMSLAFYFKGGRLNQAAVNVPWWSHWSTYAQLERDYGHPLASQLLPHDWVRLHGWALANSATLFYNRDVPLNPLKWSGIYWRSARECSLHPCFRPAGESGH